MCTQPQPNPNRIPILADKLGLLSNSSSLDEKSLKSKGADYNEPELTDEHLNLSNSEKQIELESNNDNKNDKLFQLLNSLKATDKLDKLKSQNITSVNDLTMAIFDTGTLEELQWDSSLITKVTRTLQLRYEFVRNHEWPITVESSSKLLDLICEKHVNTTSFCSLSYIQLVCDFLSKASTAEKSVIEDVWMKNNELRKKMKSSGIPLSFFDELTTRINQPNELTGEVIDELIEMDSIDQKLKDFEIDQKEANNIRIRHAEFKKRRSEMKKKESHQSKEKASGSEEELKKQKENIQKAKTILNNIKKNLAQTSTNIESKLKEGLNKIEEQLKVKWHFEPDDLIDPASLLDRIHSDLDKTEKEFDLGKAYQSDEELVEKISAGIALKGINFHNSKKLGHTATRPLLARPSYCSLKGPSMRNQTERRSFCHSNALNEIRQAIEMTGFTAAATFSLPKSVVPADAGFAFSSNTTSRSLGHEKMQSMNAVVIEYRVVPIHCFRIPREEMKLSMEAKNQLEKVNDLEKAKEFLNEFYSHVCEGDQHIGGIFMCIVEVNTTTQTSLKELYNLAATHLDIWGRGALCENVDGGVGIGFTKTRGDMQGTEKISKQSSIRLTIEQVGPAIKNPDLFTQVLYMNNSSLRVIDRGPISSFTPIWKIIETQEKYSNNSQIQKAALLLKEAWLKIAEASANHELIKEEIQRVLGDPQESSWSCEKNTVSMHEQSSVPVATNEDSQFAKSGSFNPIPCSGRSCATCGRCRDWYFTGDQKTWQWIQDVNNWTQNDKDRYCSSGLWELFKRRVGYGCVRKGVSGSLYHNSFLVRSAVFFGLGSGHSLDRGVLCLCGDNIIMHA
ncbi:unnamed protein product [Adineta steineri]|uniref:Uncharacterized protein n=1 Tax=Adineta steineri TaxID=433720 RepID=A0A818LZY7_9BILA|nr:unnamed protein product [Adineta steineri]CAF3586962.1 unnamed protein product [Adineta steineri]